MSNDAPSQQQNLNPRVVTLGTAGGPRWWSADTAAHSRAGIATAVCVGDAVYLVDAGHGVGRQMMLAGLNLRDLRGIFLTHLHSDHTIDLASLAIFGLFELGTPRDTKIALLGPGDRGALPPTSPRATGPVAPLNPASPTPGTREMFGRLVDAFATDLNDRILDSLRPSPHAFFDATDIELPGDIGYHPNDNPTPTMEPFEIYRDDLVTVTAILVEHPPVAPAFAFRFDTAEGSVTISGDTAPCENLVRLARGTDLLLHEVIDFDYMETFYGSDASEVARASLDHHYKSHTGVLDTARLATDAGAARLALHHLVPGNRPRSVWQAAGDAFDGEFYISEDLDVISFARGAAASDSDRENPGKNPGKNPGENSLDNPELAQTSAA
ncbi:MBL fold metallo-hydrolase [Micrococcales bacterium 31B]|nr:MBL fold metallo-hydrolase [Micrococcales bacterium 31B]